MIRDQDHQVIFLAIIAAGVLALCLPAIFQGVYVAVALLALWETRLPRDSFKEIKNV